MMYHSSTDENRSLNAFYCSTALVEYSHHLSTSIPLFYLWGRFIQMTPSLGAPKLPHSRPKKQVHACSMIKALNKASRTDTLGSATHTPRRYHWLWATWWARAINTTPSHCSAQLLFWSSSNLLYAHLSAMLRTYSGRVHG